MSHGNADWCHRILAAQAENAQPLVVGAAGWTAVPHHISMDISLTDAPPDVVTYVAEQLAQQVQHRLQGLVGQTPSSSEERIVPLLSDLLRDWDDLRRASGHRPPTELDAQRTGLLERTARQIAPPAGPTGPVGSGGAPGPLVTDPSEEQPHTLLRRATPEELTRLAATWAPTDAMVPEEVDQAAGFVAQPLAVGGRCSPYGRALTCLEKGRRGALPETAGLRRALVWFLALAFTEGAAEPDWSEEALGADASRWQRFVVAAHVATEEYLGPQLARALHATGCPMPLRGELVARYLRERDLLLAYDDEERT